MKICRNLFFFTFVAALLSPLVSFSQDDADKDVKQYVICRNQKIVRTIRVECQEKNQECDTIYTKDGTDRVEGFKNNILGGQKILGNIKTNLENAAWKCNDVTANAKIAD